MLHHETLSTLELYFYQGCVVLCYNNTSFVLVIRSYTLILSTTQPLNLVSPTQLVWLKLLYDIHPSFTASVQAKNPKHVSHGMRTDQAVAVDVGFYRGVQCSIFLASATDKTLMSATTKAMVVMVALEIYRWDHAYHYRFTITTFYDKANIH